MYKLLIFVGLQVLCLQNVYSHAINNFHPTETVVTEIIESVDSLINLPRNEEPVAVVNLPHPHPICPQCGRPAHLCDCGCRQAVTVTERYSSVTTQPKDNLQTICPQCGRPAHLCDCGCRQAVTVSDSYSSVTIQPKDNLQTICPHCGLSAELCSCNIPVVTETLSVTNEPKDQTVCPQCGQPAGLCKCGFFPLVTLTEAPKVNEPGSGPICLCCGHPVELCTCDLSKVLVTEVPTLVGQFDQPQSMCPRCGLPVEHCTCAAHQ